MDGPPRPPDHRSKSPLPLSRVVGNFFGSTISDVLKYDGTTGAFQRRFGMRRWFRRTSARPISYCRRNCRQRVTTEGGTSSDDQAAWEARPSGIDRPAEAAVPRLTSVST